MLLWNAVDGFSEIEDPFLIKDNEITYQGDQSQSIIPGKDGFIPLHDVWGGGIVSSGSNDGVIVDTVDTVANTIVLPQSIMLYAVDEYWLVNKIYISKNFCVNDNRVAWTTSNINSRRYPYDAILIVNAMMWIKGVTIEASYMFEIKHYDSNGSLLYLQINVRTPYILNSFIQCALSGLYQHVKPDGYPSSVYWAFTEIQIDTNLITENVPVYAKLLVLYNTAGNDGYMPS